MAEGCSHKFCDSGYCVRCGDTFHAVQVRDLQALVDQYEKVASDATRLAQDAVERVRIAEAAAGSDAHWLIKDFNVLYQATRDLLLAVGTGDETKTAHALNYAASQLERLKPAFGETQEVKRRLREKGRG